MKKFISIVAFILCLISTYTAALASGEVYTLPALNMDITPPNGWITFTRDMYEWGADLQLLGYDKDTLSGIYLDNDIYLNTISQDPFAEIIVTMQTSAEIDKAYDLNIRNDKELASMQRELIDEHTSSGASVSKYEMYDHAQALFAVVEYSQSANSRMVYSKDYSTIINGQAIKISLHSYDIKISEDLSKTLVQMVDSITFTEVKKKSPYNMLSILIGTFGIFLVLGFVVFYKTRISRKKSQTYKKDVKKAIKNKYTRW